MSNPIVRALEHAAGKLAGTLGEDAGKAVKNLYHQTGHNLKQVAENTAEADAKHASALRKLLGDGRNGEPHEPHGTGGGRGGREGSEEPPLGGRGGPGQPSEGNSGRTTGGDPVDVVSGQMITSATDVLLPGTLPLVLRRAYASGYANGRWFGPGWSSTLDQRVEIDGEGIHYAGEDAEILSYPMPSPEQPVVLPARGARWPLCWDAETDTIRIEDPATGWTRHFGPTAVPAATARPLTLMTDRNGNRVDYDYGDGPLPRQLTHSGGYRVAVDNVITPGGPRVEALRLLDGGNAGLGTALLQYQYDPRGRLIGLVDSTGVPFGYDWDEHDRIVRWTDRNGHWYAYEYDADGRVSRGYGPDGVLDAEFHYDPTGLATTVTDSLGHRTTYDYDEHGHLTATTDPLGRTVRTRYDEFGRLLEHMDALDGMTRFSVDPQGHPLRVDRPNGTVWKADYNAFGLPVRVEAPDGAVWRHAYDERGNRVETVDPTGAATRFGYDDRGGLASVTDALGEVTTVRCNGAGLAEEVVDPLGASTRYSYDPAGRVVEVADALGSTVRQEWTVEGRLAARTTADGAVERWTYDGEGNPVLHVDQIGAATAREYGVFNRLAALVTADGSRHVFRYDTELRCREVVNPQGLTWTYGRDPLGRLTEEQDFNGRSVSYRRDAAGRLESRTNGAGQTVRYHYDLVGNLTRKESDGAVTTFVHDPADRLVRVSGPNAQVLRSYDASGHLVEETVNGRTVTHAHDLLGRRTARTTPSGHETTRAYDAAGRLSTLTAAGQAMAFGRDAEGRETARRLPGGMLLASEHDVRGRLIRQSLTGGDHAEPTVARSYEYRQDSRLVAMRGSSGSMQRFSLDPLGRVTAVSGEEEHSGPTESYAYDVAGNLVEASWGAGGTTGGGTTGGRSGDAEGRRTHTGTLVRSAGRLRYEYDAQGRVVRRHRTTLSGRTDTTSFHWDAEDRLTEVVTPEGDRWRYLYDAFGRRIAKQRLVTDGEATTLTEWTEFTWDGALLVEQTAHGPRLPGPYTVSWDHHGLHPVAQTEVIVMEGGDPAGQARRFFSVLTDLVGTPVSLVSEQGRVAWRSGANLWGTSNGTSGVGETSTPLRFPGQYYDPESRLHYNVHRYYDPGIAAYLSPDPLGLIPGPNPYAYVGNPLLAADPLGLAEQPPMGERSNPFPDREAAERAAFQLAGVPYGTAPDEQWVMGGDVRMRGMPRYVYTTNETHWGNMRQFETEQGSKVVVEHTHDPAGSHFHAGEAKPDGSGEPRFGVNFGWNGSDPVNDEFERYLKIDKPGGDHHLFYRGGTVCPG